MKNDMAGNCQSLINSKTKLQFYHLILTVYYKTSIIISFKFIFLMGKNWQNECLLTHKGDTGVIWHAIISQYKNL